METKTSTTITARFAVALLLLVVSPMARAASTGIDPARQKLQQRQTTARMLRGLSVHPLSRLSPFRDRTLLTPEVKAQLTTIRDYLRAQANRTGNNRVIRLGPYAELQIALLAVTKDGSVSELRYGKRLTDAKVPHRPTVHIAGYADPKAVLTDIANAAATIQAGHGAFTLSDL